MEDLAELRVSSTCSPLPSSVTREHTDAFPIAIPMGAMGDDRMFADLPETIARGEISDCIGAKRER